MFEAIEAEIDDSTSFAPRGARHAAARSIERVAGGQFTGETDWLTSVARPARLGQDPDESPPCAFAAWGEREIGTARLEEAAAKPKQSPASA